MPEFRKDPTLGRWVIIATERVRRPTDFPRRRAERRGGPCALCSGHERETPPEVLAYRDSPAAPADSAGWRVRVVPNKFPAFRTEGDFERRDQGLYDLMNCLGTDGLLLESSDHDGNRPGLPAAPLEGFVRA